ncbi:MAG TPA: LemA family protein [Candidatus Thermoplasmatota archaeon]|nr:LemA family protein [Candidatus Thermoplasmatota archaeon]
MALLGWIVGVALVAAIVLIFVNFYNRIIRFENAIDNSWAQIDVQLQRRGELIPNLVETVKGYAKHEREVLDNVTRARAGLLAAKTPQDKMAAEGILEQTLGKLFAVAEAYPDLKANANFLSLQDELSHTENKISFARQAYNDAVLRFNNAVETFPGNVFAGMMGRKERVMLEVPVASKEVPRVSF